jgi:diguanylate cyclase (GGDEF)-like protein
LNVLDAALLFLRLLTGALCLHASRQSWRRALSDPTQPRRRRRAGIAGVLIAVIGLLAILVGADEAFRRPRLRLPLDWFSAFIDVCVPLFYLYALRALGERDVLERRLADAAERDPLTALANRAGFASQAAVLLANCDRTGRPVAIAVLDIDRFKAINDGWGHAAGDVALRGLARVAGESLRDGDVLARFGGEEFVVLLAGDTPESALPVIERLRAAITQGVPHPGAPELRLTVSAGIAAVVGRDHAAIEAAANAADAALYRAKEAGRDRALLWAPA